MPLTGRYGRRRFLRALAALVVTSSLPAMGAAPRGRLRFMALGQAAIQYDLREHPYPGFAALAALTRQADICFTDLETPIAGPGAEKATRDTIFLKAAEPAGFDCLEDLSVNVVALHNKHARGLAPGRGLAPPGA